MVEILDTVPTLKGARRILDELAIKGGFKPVDTGQYCVIYERVKRDSSKTVRERLLVVKKAPRQWQITKSIGQEGL